MTKSINTTGGPTIPWEPVQSAEYPQGSDRVHPRQLVAVVVCALMVVVMIAAWVMVAMIGVLPAKYFWPILIFDVLLGAGAVVLLLTTGRVGHNRRYVLSMILTLVVILGNLGVFKVASDYTAVLEDMVPSGETVQYDLIGLKDGPDDLAAFIGAQIPLDSSDSLFGQACEKAEELVSLVLVPVSGQAAVVDSVIKSETKGGIIQHTYLQILEEAVPDTYDQVKIIASFSVNVMAPTKTPTPTPTATPTQAIPSGAETPFIVYISGIDTAGPVSSRSRSDVNILMAVNPKTGKIVLVSTPRDFYVQLHGTTGLRDKLTHAGVHGIDMSVATLEDLYGINVDYYLRVNFTSLVTIVNAIGGVDVNSEYAFSAGGFSFQEGMNHMNGAQALAFSRERYSFASGDRQRGKNQEAVIEAIIHKISSPKMVTQYQQILNAINGAFETSMLQDAISAQVKLMLSKNTNWNITSMSVDGTGALLPTYAYPGQPLYVMIPDQATVDAAIAAIKATLAGQ